MISQRNKKKLFHFGQKKNALPGAVRKEKAANHNNCRLLCDLFVILKVIFAKCGPRSDCSLIRVHTVCLYAKIGLESLQEYSADSIFRCRFSWCFNYCTVH